MFSLKNEEKYIKKTFILIQLIFMCVTLFTIFKYGNSLLLGSLEKFDNDDVRYIRSAWTLINKKIISYHNINESTVYIMPGLTFTLSFFTLLFGKFGGITAFKIFQLILQMTSIYLIFLIGRKVFNSKVAIIACILDALYICEIYTANLILMECSFKFLLLLLIYISIYAVETKSIKLYILGGIIWALACLFRPTVGAYPIVILIMWIKNKYNFKDIIKFTLIVSTVFCLILSPWWIRNYKVFNMFIPFTKSTGNPFLQGTYVHNNAVNPTPYKIVDDLIEQDTIEINTGIYRLKTYVTKKPLLYLYWYTIGKTLFLWAVPFYWKTILFIPSIVVTIYHWIILIIGGIGITKNIKKNENSLFIFLVILYFNLIYLPYYTFGRYSYPIMPLVMIFAASQIALYLNKLKLQKTL